MRMLRNVTQNLREMWHEDVNERQSGWYRHGGVLPGEFVYFAHFLYASAEIMPQIMHGHLLPYTLQFIIHYYERWQRY